MNNATAPQHNVPPKRSSLLLALIALTVLVVASTLVGWLGIPGTGGAPAPKTMAAVGGKITIPLAELKDGQARYYRYDGQGGKIPFFVVKGKDEVVHAAFDACDVCYQAKKGYQQQGEEMVCKNCNQTFPVARIGTKSGGCNPSPLNFTRTSTVLEIAVSDLEAGARYFR